MGSYLKLKKMLEEKERFALVCHIEPDGDAIGSTLSLGLALESIGKKATLVCKDPIPAVFQFMIEDIGFTTTLPEADAVILLDNGDMRRTGLSDELKILKKSGIAVANIDHHPKNDLWKFASINYADDSASSACEIIYRILADMELELTPRLATCLLAGIFYDTGGFRHDNTTTKVLDIVSDLLKKGARLKKISDNLGSSHPVSMFKLWGTALSRLSLIPGLGLSVSLLTRDDIEEAGATEDDVSGLVNLLNSAPESRAALLLYETKDAKIKGSLRTDMDGVDVSLLAKFLGGGGHKKAAGFTIEGKIEKNVGGWQIT